MWSGVCATHGILDLESQTIRNWCSSAFNVAFVEHVIPEGFALAHLPVPERLQLTPDIWINSTKDDIENVYVSLIAVEPDAGTISR